jgi:hypothetical protein
MPFLRAPNAASISCSILQLPPALRSSIVAYALSPKISNHLNVSNVAQTSRSKLLNHSSCQRSFHSSSPQQSILHTALDSLVSVPHSTITTLHTALGLPWWASLTGTALLLRTCIIAPLIQLPLRKKTQEALDLMPLRLANQLVQRDKYRAEISQRNRLNGAAAERSFRRGLQRAIALQDAQFRRRWRLWGRMKMFFFTLNQVPIFLVVVEAVRRMAGQPVGFLGSIVESIERMLRVQDGDASASGNTAVSQEIGKVEMPMDYLEKVASNLNQLETVSDATASAALNLSAYYDPTFTTGGFLWFPDLTATDPHWVLPILVGWTMLSVQLGNRYLRDKTALMADRANTVEAGADTTQGRIRTGKEVEAAVMKSMRPKVSVKSTVKPSAMPIKTVSTPSLLSSPKPTMTSSHASTNTNPILNPLTKGQKRSERVFKIMASFLFFSPLILVQFPAGVLWYWWSSSVFAFLSDRILDWWMPLRKPIVPPKRPYIMVGSGSDR